MINDSAKRSKMKRPRRQLCAKVERDIRKPRREIARFSFGGSPGRSINSPGLKIKSLHFLNPEESEDRSGLFENNNRSLTRDVSIRTCSIKSTSLELTRVCRRRCVKRVNPAPDEPE